MAKRKPKRPAKPKRRNGAATLKPDPDNARLHDARNAAAIASSLEQFGAGRSILADADGIIRAGNGTFAEAQRLGLPVRVVETDGSELVVVKRTDLRGDRARAMAVSDNRTGETSSWDQAKLDALCGELRGAFDLDAIGLADGDLDTLCRELRNEAKAGLTDPDDVPEVPKVPVTKPGDLWLLGAFFQCEDCGKVYEYDVGLKMKECPCG